MTELESTRPDDDLDALELELPPPEVRLQLLQTERGMWNNTRWQARARYDVAKLLDEQPGMDQARTELSRAVKAIRFLDEMIKELQP